MQMERPQLLLGDEIDSDLSFSRSWTYDFNGTMCHKATGMKVSPDEGITCEGREYKLSAEDIELDVHSHLGCGSCGTVRQGMIRTAGLPVAIKTLKVDRKEQREQLVNEVRGLIQAEGCPCLVQWYAGFVSRRNGQVHIVLELMDFGSLADLKQRLAGRAEGSTSRIPPSILARMVSQMVQGLDHLHARRILHRDIKPANVLLDSRGDVKLSDFGITKVLDQTMASTSVGTQVYMSPERCDVGSYSLPADVWSLGMVVYELATGRHPFNGATTFAALLHSLIDQPEPRLDETDGHSTPLCDFVACCLTRNVTERATAAQLLTHEFVTTHVASQEELSEWLKSICELEIPDAAAIAMPEKLFHAQ